MTTEQSTELQNTLETMLTRIAMGDDITEQLFKIQEISIAIESTAPTMLKHYLQKKSYTKALDFLKEE
ncbi:hypothetical protein F4X73_07560 [Candidatus Poribacteria bacterium]|nr:hypothetical protein [Candidatus Poribacteria bacterium]MYB64533.1 hypothetical protein [Candidatus Poribacteria bacterium]MYF54926.1 hypothetical protein [Candidatus Poribacteria bacterium]